MRKKRIRISFFILLIITLSTLMSMLTACSSSEIPIPEVEENVYIYDEDNVIDDDVEETLNGILVDLEEKTEAEFAVVSVQSLLNKTIEEYSNELFNTLGIGKEGEDNGVLLLFSRSDERVRLEIGRGMEGFLNDSKCGRILDDYFVPYREEDKYTEATEMTVKAVVSVIAEEYDVQIQGVDEEINVEEGSDDDIPVWAIVALIVFVLVIAFLFAIFGDDTGGSSGGYYGGSSGGGFSSGGSFGGGFSGGGGASR